MEVIMKKRHLFSVIIAFSLISISNISYAQSANELLPKAIQLEEVQGDLQKAIDIYITIIRDFPENKSAAANAQLHLGFCYEKLGLKKAEEAYQNVLTNYPDQLDLVKVAREKLELYASKPLDKTIDDNGLVIKKVWEDPPETYGGGISPNGRYLSFINWESVEISVHDLETKKTWDVTDIGSWDPNKGQFPDASVWSPDSKQIVSWWMIGKGENLSTELRLSDFNGGPFTTLVKAKFDKVPYPLKWSNDGKKIWCMQMFPDPNIENSDQEFKTPRNKYITTVSVPDGKIEKVLNVGKASGTGKVDISLDDNYFIYDLTQANDSTNHDIHMYSAKDKKDLVIAAHPAHDWAPQWSQDGKQILFLSERTGNIALWSISIENGKPVGDPVLLQKAIPEAINPLGITDSGKYFYAISNQIADLYTAEMDFSTGKLTKQPKKLSVGMEGINYKPLWHSDGKTLIYFLQKIEFSKGKLLPTVIVKHDIESSKEISFTAGEFTLNPANPLSYPALTSDGQNLVVHWMTQTRPTSFVKINIRTGEIETLIESKGQQLAEMSVCPRLSDDGTTLFYLLNDKKSFISHDINTGKETTIYKSEYDIYPIAYSPDLKRVAFRYWGHQKNTIWIMAMDGSKPKPLGSLKEDESMEYITWTPDGKYVLFISSQSQKLYKADTEDNKGFEECDLDMKNRTHIQVHPDGKTIVFTEYKGQYQEVWMMENYLPKK